jgi:hypothetical protein
MDTCRLHWQQNVEGPISSAEPIRYFFKAHPKP